MANDPDQTYCFGRTQIFGEVQRVVEGRDPTRCVFSRNYLTEAQFRNILDVYFSEDFSVEYHPFPLRARLTRRK